MRIHKLKVSSGESNQLGQSVIIQNNLFSKYKNCRPADRQAALFAEAYSFKKKGHAIC